MSNKKIAIPVIATTILGTSICGANVFADSHPYNIEYSGGTNLGENNLTVNAELVENLTPLIKAKKVSVAFKPASSTKWKNGYIRYNDSEGCAEFKYIEVSPDNPPTGMGFVLSNGQYDTSVDFVDTKFDGVSSASKKFAIGIRVDTGSLYAGKNIYSAASCSDGSKIDSINQLKTSDGEKMFIETAINPHTIRDGALVTASDLYFGLTDVDAGQSFKVLNTGNELSKDNMFVKSIDAAQNTGSGLKNKFKNGENENYIYSETSGDEVLNLQGKDGLRIKLTEATQQQGLKMVFGFSHPAASGIEYYAQQFEVNYTSDDHGEISGIKNESIISGKNPSGSTSIAKENYKFAYWIANIDVVLMDGTTIKAGSPITPEQLQQIKVTQAITLTAVHKDASTPDTPAADTTPVATPDTGNPTGEMNAIVVPASIVSALLGAACLARFLSRFNYKKVDFKK